MKFIRQILYFLLLPAVAYGQTVHVDEDRIVYKGTVPVANTSKVELYERAKEALHHVKSGIEDNIEENKDKGMITAKGKIRLVTPWYLIRTVEYILELSVEDGKYKYRIDSVYLKQEERGGKSVKIPSEKLLKSVEETGLESIKAEQELNEIDMNFQKLLALVNADIKKPAVVKNRDNKTD